MATLQELYDTKITNPHYARMISALNIVANEVANEVDTVANHGARQAWAIGALRNPDAQYDGFWNGLLGEYSDLPIGDSGTPNTILGASDAQLETSIRITLDGLVADTSTNQPPIASANGPYVGTTAAPIVFDASGSNDPDGTIIAYSWSFGDGTFGSGVSPSHTYASPGVHAVTLAVTDNQGYRTADATTATIT